jgi:hypothetical protein
LALRIAATFIGVDLLLHAGDPAHRTLRLLDVGSKPSAGGAAAGSL